MRNQWHVQIAGVTERYVLGAGATPVRCTCRVGFAALVAPAPDLKGIWQESGIGETRICAGYTRNQFGIHC